MEKYKNLQKYLDKNGLKLKAEKNTVDADVIKAEFKGKESKKASTQAERLDRIERLLGIE